MKWADTSVVVTGASRGIGRAVALAMARRGARVGAIARTGQDLEDLRREEAGGGHMVVAEADVSVRSEVEAALASLRRQLGAIDVLVNNAGIGLYGAVAQLDPDDAERLVHVNYLGTVYPTLAVLPEMIERRRGAIVNVGSIAGRIGAPFEAAYSASKFAVVGFTEALALEVAPLGVRVSMVNPGPVDTGFFAARGHPYARRAPRPIPPDRVAAAVLAAVERPRLERTLPRSLRLATLVRLAAPRFYQVATTWVFRSELAALAAAVTPGRGDATASAAHDTTRTGETRTGEIRTGETRPMEEQR